eukprot:9467553-Pyramimonas_sp.AAC.3
MRTRGLTPARGHPRPQGGHHSERHNNHKRRRRGTSKLLFDDDKEGNFNGTSVGQWMEMPAEEAEGLE